MSAAAKANGSANLFRIAAWGCAALLLALPAVAMRFTDEVNWTAADFVFAGVLIGGVGLAAEFLLGRSASLSYRFGAALALLAAFLTVWVNAAVGIIGSEDNSHNLLFLGVVAAATIGAIVARFRAAGMARVMAVAAVAHAAVALAGYASDPRGAITGTVLAGLWLAAAALFRKATTADR